MPLAPRPFQVYLDHLYSLLVSFSNSPSPAGPLVSLVTAVQSASVELLI